jgi:hypothetical protein
VLVNNTGEEIRCRPAAASGPAREQWSRALAPGAEMPVARGVYNCRSERAEVPVPVGRSSRLERISVTATRDGSLTYASQPLD